MTVCGLAAIRYPLRAQNMHTCWQTQACAQMRWTACLPEQCNRPSPTMQPLLPGGFSSPHIMMAALTFSVEIRPQCVSCQMPGETAHRHDIKQGNELIFQHKTELFTNK